MLINISPAEANIDETLIALSYGQRVKKIQNDPQRNVESIELSRIKEI